LAETKGLQGPRDWKVSDPEHQTIWKRVAHETLSKSVLWGRSRTISVEPKNDKKSLNPDQQTW
jgi:hypothetical protein